MTVAMQTHKRTAPHNRATRGGALQSRRRHRQALVQITRSGIPFLIGGG